MTILACVVIGFECFIFSIVAGLGRKKVFTEDIINKFTDEHAAVYGAQSKPSPMGFPDAGNGFYADKLPYKKWLDFNNGYRVHQNFVEQLPQVFGILLISGLIIPQWALYAAWIHVVARPIYAAGYMKSGPNMRIPGAIGGILPLYVLGVMSLVALVKERF